MVSEEALSPFASVEGNNDWNYDFPKSRKIQLMDHTIFIFHGTGYTYSENLMVERAKEEKADVVFFGHTHMFFDETISNIRFINPGSTLYNRDLTSPCYARVYLNDDGSIHVERIDL